MSGTENFDYQFIGPNNTADDFFVTVDDTPSNTTGYGSSYTVEGIHGGIDGVPIDGLDGAKGVVTNNGTFIYDNAIFTSSSNGLVYDGASGSSSGIDVAACSSKSARWTTTFTPITAPSF